MGRVRLAVRRHRPARLTAASRSPGSLRSRTSTLGRAAVLARALRRRSTVREPDSAAGDGPKAAARPALAPPSELDLMARVAGLALREHSAGWGGEPTMTFEMTWIDTHGPIAAAF